MNPADIKNITIETPRLILRQPTMDDVDAIHKAKTEAWSDLQQWMGWSSDDQGTYEATQAYVEKSLKRWESGSLSFSGFCPDTGDFIISSGLNQDDASSFSTGYWMPASWRGRGLASETCNAMIRVAFDLLGATQVTIGHFVGNIPSRRVVEKMGFTYTHTKEKGMMQFSTGEMIDELRYARHNLNGLPPLAYCVLHIG